MSEVEFESSAGSSSRNGAEFEVKHMIEDGLLSGSDHRNITCAPDGAPLYAVPEATEAEIARAVGAAGAAFPAWAATSNRFRAAILRDAAQWLLDREDQIALHLVRETGRVLSQARGEVRGAARILGDYAAVDIDRDSMVMRSSSETVWGLQFYEPRGVAALITAWNVPLQLAAHKVGAALMAGCTAVLKPSPLAARTPRALALALRAAGLPPGVLSILYGGAPTALALASHPKVNVVSFTGGQLAGEEIARVTSSPPRKLILELGGKSANIVFDDAPVEGLVDGLISGFTRNQGAVCTAGSRIIVHQSRYDEVLEAMTKRMDSLTVGDPFCDVADLGALRSREVGTEMDRVLAAANGAGGNKVIGGQAVEVPGRSGTFRRPALVAARSWPVTGLWREELFLPVAVMVPFDDEDEAISAANDTDHGLAAGIWTTDLSRAERVWSAVDVGTIYLNSYHRADSVPLASGGRRVSGYGAEGGGAGVLEFLTTKSVHARRTSRVT